MTRKGSLAYYACAVVVGSLLLAVTYFVYFTRTAASNQGARDFFFVYFFVFLLTFLPLVLSSFLLRRIALAFRWRTPLLWTLLGTAVFIGVVLAFGLVGRVIQQTPAAVGTWWKTPVLFLFIGPWYAMQQPLWLLIPGALANSFLLFRVNRAFEHS
jgi:hypothetical protein